MSATLFFCAFMSKAKLQKFAEFDAFPNTFDAKCTLKGQWNSYFQNQHPLLLELACGKADYCIGLARLHPDKNYIGVDVKGNRLWRGAKTALEEQLHHCAFLRIQIDHLEDYFAPGEVEEIWITFADPQPGKPRKRLTHPIFLERYRKVLKPGGRIHLKTDSELLFESTLEVLAELNIEPQRIVRDVYVHGTPEPELAIQTFYERMWLAEGRTIRYLNFKLP